MGERYHCNACGAYITAGDGHSCYEPISPIEHSKERYERRIAELEQQLEMRKEAINAQFKLMERVKKLEKALRDVRTELETNAGLRNEYQDWADTFAIIDSVL